MIVDVRDASLQLVRNAGGVAIDLAPLQGLWTEEQYLKLSNSTNTLIEFTDGHLELLPMPTRTHQLVVRVVFLALHLFMQPRGGMVLFAPLRMQVRPGKQREPDILLIIDKHDSRSQDSFWLGADLVVEVVSEDDPERDTVEKVADYAEAGIPEYWIVDPLDATITVLTLQGAAYATHGVWKRGEQAASVLLDGFGVSVDEVFDAE